MSDVFLVGKVETFGDLDADIKGFLPFVSFRHSVGQRAALCIFTDDDSIFFVTAGSIDIYNVLMTQ